MAEKSVNINYEEFADYSALSPDKIELIESTMAFANNAYAPYSNFFVSALAKLADGGIIKATNVENASYPISLCAERNLLGTIISNHPGVAIQSIVIFVDKDLDDPVSPCGMCRQALLEAERNQGSDIELLLVSKNKHVIIISRIADLLPLSFVGIGL